MATIIAKDKYFLKSLHDEIGLYDRKLAHLQKYETFASDKERDAAAAKMNTKRATLVRTAQSLVEEGVEFKPSELPHSLRPADFEAVVDAPAVSETHDIQKPASVTAEPTYGGTQLDYRTEITNYLRERKRTHTASQPSEAVA